MSDVAEAKPVIDLSHRDLTVDLVRVFCVLFVVAIHLLEVGVGKDASGALSVSRPLEHQFWFNGLTWAGQIMPVFFMVGGFAGITAWRRMQARGGTAAEFVRVRVIRLALPALPLFVFYVIVIGVATALRVPPKLLQDVLTGAGSPLWFVAAYVLVQALVPTMSALHAKRPLLTIAGLLALTIVVDAIRYANHNDALGQYIGLFNLAFVWLFMQQLGFWYADGWFARRRWWTLLGIAIACYLLLYPLTWWIYDPNLLSDLNPPTIPLIVVGIAQTCVLQLLKPALARLMETKGARAVVFLAGTRLMTIYLWHLPLIIALSGLTLLVPGAAPEPATPAWWWSRIPFYLVTLALLFAISIPLRRFERPHELSATPPNWVVALGVALTFVPAFLVLEWFLRLSFAIVGAVTLAAVALLLDRRPKEMSLSVE